MSKVTANGIQYSVRNVLQSVPPMSHLPGCKYLIKACSGWLLRAAGCWSSSSGESEGSSREATRRELSAVCSSDHILRFPFRVYWLSSSFLSFSLSLARSGAETAQTVRPQVPENHEMHKMVKHKNRNHSQPASVPSCSWFGKMLHGCSQTQGPSVK